MANPYTAYVETKVMTASPLELVHLAYEGAIDALGEARDHLYGERIVARVQATTRAQQIIIHLQASLDFEKGGELSRRLSSLYDYILKRINEGNRQESDAPFAEAQNLLATLDEGWKQIATGETGVVAGAPAEEVTSPWSTPAEPVLSYASPEPGAYGSPEPAFSYGSPEPAFYSSPEPAFYTSAGYL